MTLADEVYARMPENRWVRESEVRLPGDVDDRTYAALRKLVKEGRIESMRMEKRPGEVNARVLYKKVVQ